MRMARRVRRFPPEPRHLDRGEDYGRELQSGTRPGNISIVAAREVTHERGKGLDKPISTRVHGILDYATVGTLLTLPRLLKASPKAANMLAIAGTGLLGYSLATRYEYSLWKKIPMPVHLALDGISGAALLAAPFTFLKGETTTAIAGIVGIGVMEVGAALLTQPKPPVGEQAKYAYLDLAS